MGTDVHSLGFAVDIGTIVPITRESVRVDPQIPHPDGCWLRSGIDAAALRQALMTTFASPSAMVPPAPVSLTLNAQLVAQEEHEEIGPFGSTTRKVHIAVRYALAKPPLAADVWSELVTSDGSVQYSGNVIDEGLIGRKSFRQSTGEFVSVARLAYERAIRQNIHTLAQRLRDVTPP